MSYLGDVGRLDSTINSDFSKYTYEYIATAGQTVFSGLDANSASMGYSVGNILVSYGGADLAFSDYTATDGTSIVLADGAVAGKIIRVVAFQAFEVSDAYTKIQSDNLLANKAPIDNPSFTGNLDVTGTVTADGLVVDVASSSQQITFSRTVSSTGTGKIGSDVSQAMGLWGTDGTKVATFSQNKDISFFEDTGTTPKFFWDASAENLSLDGGADPLTISRNGGTDSNVSIRFKQLSSSWYAGASGSKNFGIGTTADIGVAPVQITPAGSVSFGEPLTISQLIADGKQGVVIDGGNGALAASKFNGICAIFKRENSTGQTVNFMRDASVVGHISVDTTSTSYNTSSDYRLKEDDVPMTGATERVKALRPINFAWKASGSRVDGFFAHELAEVVPEAATGTKDAMMDEEYEVTPAVYEDVTTPAVEAVLDEDGMVITEAVEEYTESVLVTEAVMGTRSVPDYQGIDQSKLVPLLTATIQELIARIEILEAK